MSDTLVRHSQSPEAAVAHRCGDERQQDIGQHLKGELSFCFLHADRHAFA